MKTLLRETLMGVSTLFTQRNIPSFFLCAGTESYALLCKVQGAQSWKGPKEGNQNS